MAGILRLIDDSLWDGSAKGWSRLISHLVPIEVILEPPSASRYIAKVKKTGFANSPWDKVLTDKDPPGVPIQWTLSGIRDGALSVESGPWQILSTGGKGVTLDLTCDFVPEVIRIHIGRPTFLEIQLMTGRPVSWIREGPGPAENQLFGGEWDVLCLDMCGPDLSVDFHAQWNQWYRDSGLLQAFRTVLLYSSSADTVTGQYGDTVLFPRALERLEPYKAADPKTVEAPTVFETAREVLSWRALDGTTLDPLVLPSSQEMLQQWQRLRRAAETDGGVLIEGDSGTGKTTTAQLVHRWSGRSPARFVHANCAGWKEDLGKDELFGHVKGAFTGADRARLGLLTLADTGTLFLDEIHRLEPTLQGALLKVLDRGRFLPQGAAKELTSDLRVVSATNNPPAAEKLQEDLRNRLFHTRIRLPNVTEYNEADFTRLVQVCWERLRLAIVDYFNADRARKTWAKSNLGDSDFDALLDSYRDRVPPSNLHASGRAQARLDHLTLGDDAIHFLFLHRSQLRGSNVRGLVAWLRRAVLQCSADERVIRAETLAECSPVAIGLVRESPTPTESIDPIQTELQLAELLASAVDGERKSKVSFPDLCGQVGQTLDLLVRQNKLVLSPERLIPFLYQTFQNLQRILEKERELSLVRPGRSPGARWARAFFNRKSGHRWLFEASLPAFGASEAKDRLREADEYLKTKIRTRG